MIVRDENARTMGAVALVLIFGTLAVAIVALFLPRVTTTGVSKSAGAAGCVAGGSTVTFCLDWDGDGACTHPNDVVHTTHEICNGETGPAGEAGPQGEQAGLLAAIQGFVAFYWPTTNAGQKAAWIMVDPELGRTLGPPIGYSVAENRVSGGGAKLQYGPGNTTRSIVSIVRTSISSQTYFLQHDVDVPSYYKVDLQLPLANHSTPVAITWDSVYTRYVAATDMNGASEQGIVVVDSDTGVLTPLSGYDGTLGPSTTQVLDILAVGDRIAVFKRDDTVMGQIDFYNRADGQYTGFSTFNGTIVPYPNTFAQTWIGMGLTFWWLQSVGYDPATHRLHVVIGSGGGEPDRNYAWIQAASDADMAAQLQAGNYTLYLTQNQPDQVINAAAWLPLLP